MESHRIKVAEVGYNRFTMTPNRWKKDFNAIGIIPSSGKYSLGTFAHPDIAFEFASWLNVEFKLYLITEFERLKKSEAYQSKIEWSVNRELSCLVAFELKLGEFKAEYSGKMNLYLEALDRDVKKEQENPSVGVILCSSKDEDVVEYSISKNMSQTMISEYKLKLIDKKLLETKLKEMKNLIDNKDK